MTHWTTVFRFELRQLFRRKAYLFVTFGVPLLAVLTFYGYRWYQDWGEGKDEAPPAEVVPQGGSSPLGYVDRTVQQLFPPPESYPPVDCTPSPQEIAALRAVGTPSELRRAAIKRLASPYCARDWVRAYADVSAGLAALDAGDVGALYEMPPDFVQRGEVTVYVGALNIQAMETQAQFEDFLLRSALYNVPPEKYEVLYLRLRDPAFVTEHRISEANAKTEARNDTQAWALVYAFGLLTMLGMMWGSGYLMQSVLQEKESRVVEIVISSVRPTALLAGKVTAMGLGSLLQVATLGGALLYLGAQAGTVSAALGNIHVEMQALMLGLVYFALGFLLFGALMAAIGALSSSVREAQNFVVVVTLPAAVPFFFLQIFAEEPSGTLPRALSLFPLTSPMAMVMRLVVSDVPAWELGLSLVLLMMSIGGAVWMAGRLFRVNVLLAGTPPSWRKLPELLLRG